MTDSHSLSEQSVSRYSIREVCATVAFLLSWTLPDATQEALADPDDRLVKSIAELIAIRRGSSS